MQIRISPYTATMRRCIPMALMIALAVIAGVLVTNYQTNTRIEKLVHSTSVTDQIKGITLLSNASFDACLNTVAPLLQEHSDASIMANELLIKKAFREDRVQDLIGTDIDSELLQSAMWWETSRVQPQPFSIPTNIQNPSPWVAKLQAYYEEGSGQIGYLELIRLPIRDRDGSVLLSVLAIHVLAPKDIDQLLRTWEVDYDTEKQKAALLLSALRGLPIPKVASQDPTIRTIQTILHEKKPMLAWRTMHTEDGMINPDIALAGMIVDTNRFTPALIESAHNNQWVHPEHPILIASTFSSNIASQIPHELLVNNETRQKWWSLFACGLLHEER